MSIRPNHRLSLSGLDLPSLLVTCIINWQLLTLNSSSEASGKPTPSVENRQWYRYVIITRHCQRSLTHPQHFFVFPDHSDLFHLTFLFFQLTFDIWFIPMHFYFYAVAPQFQTSIIRSPIFSNHYYSSLFQHIGNPSHSLRTPNRIAPQLVLIWDSTETFSLLITKLFSRIHFTSYSQHPPTHTHLNNLQSQLNNGFSSWTPRAWQHRATHNNIKCNIRPLILINFDSTKLPVTQPSHRIVIY